MANLFVKSLEMATPFFKGSGEVIEASKGFRVEDSAETLGTGAVHRVLTPPYDPQRLVELFESSSALNPAITAYEANVHGNGFRIEPVIDFSNANAVKQLKAAMMQERIMAFRARKEVYTRKDIVPTDNDVELRKADIELEMEIERCRLDSFFSTCCPFSTFSQLCSSICRDEMITGNAYVEVIRDSHGDVCQLHWLKSAGMRLSYWTRKGTGEVDYVKVDYPQRTTPITFETITITKPFRTFAQIGFGTTSFTYFKEFGDPRVVSSRTGFVRRQEQTFTDNDPDAHEVLWFSSPTQRIDSPYGIPVWIGAMPLVTGAMYAQLVNENHFNHKGIPQAFLFVEGADQTAVDALRENLRVQLEEIQDLTKYHALVIVGADSSSDDPTAKVSFKVEPMRTAIQDDGLFQKYDMQCHKHIWMQFRIPPMLLGNAEELNRATSDNVIRFAESQVFGPARQRFDDKINMLLQFGLGIRYMRFVSNSPVQRNPKDLSDMIESAGKTGALSINQVLGLHTDQFNTAYNRIDKIWADLPMVVVRGMLANEVPIDTNPPKPSGDLTPEIPQTPKDDRFEEAMPSKADEASTTREDLQSYITELAQATKKLRTELATERMWKSREIQTSKGLVLALPYIEAATHISPP